MGEHVQLSWTGFLQEARFKEKEVSLRLQLQYSNWNKAARRREPTGQRASVWVSIPATATRAIEFIRSLKDKALFFDRSETGQDIWKGPPYGSDQKAAVIEIINNNGMKTTASVKPDGDKVWLNYSTDGGPGVEVQFAKKADPGPSGGGELQRGMAEEGDRGI